MAWFYLLAAGVLEVVWSTCLKLSEGFHILKFSVPTIIGTVASFLFLAQAMRHLPLGTAYAIWTGIGVVGAVLVGIVLFREPITPARMVFTALLLVGLIGLKLSS